MKKRAIAELSSALERQERDLLALLAG